MAKPATPQDFEVDISLDERLQLHRLLSLVDVDGRDLNKKVDRVLAVVEAGEDFDMSNISEDVATAIAERVKAKERSKIVLSIEHIENIFMLVDKILTDKTITLPQRRAQNMRKLASLFQALEDAKGNEKNARVRPVARHEKTEAPVESAAPPVGETPNN